MFFTISQLEGRSNVVVAGTNWPQFCTSFQAVETKTQITENSMSQSHVPLALLILGLTFMARAVSSQEIVPLPARPSIESLQKIALLSLPANPQAPALSLEEQSRWVAFRQSVSAFQRQGLWPIRVPTTSGPAYTGEITATAAETFDLLNRQTNQNTLQRTGDVIGTILMVPVRILELFLVPQC